VHAKMVKDAAQALKVSEHSVFVKALTEKRGIDCSHIVETATNIYSEFKITGRVPEFVQDYCITKISDRRRQLARKQSELQRAPIQDPNLSLVDALEDKETFFRNDAA
jgi:hypothetical protein